MLLGNLISRVTSSYTVIVIRLFDYPRVPNFIRFLLGGNTFRRRNRAGIAHVYSVSQGMIRRQKTMVKGSSRRSKPFTELQRQTFVGILKDYRNVISNKSSTEQSILDKKRTWKEITRIFNANQLTAEERTTDQLKKLWMNMKQLQRISDRTLAATGESSSTELLAMSPTEKLFSSDMTPKEINATEERVISFVHAPDPAEVTPADTQILPTSPSLVSPPRLTVSPPLASSPILVSPSTPAQSLTLPVPAPRRKSCYLESNTDSDLEKQRLMNQIEFDTILFNEKLERQRELHEMEKEERRIKLEEAEIKLEHTKRMFSFLHATDCAKTASALTRILVTTPTPKTLSTLPTAGLRQKRGYSESNDDGDSKKQRILNQIEFDTIVFTKRLQRKKELYKMEKEQREIKLGKARIKLEHTKRICELEYNKKQKE